MSVVTTTPLPHSLTTYRGGHGKLRLWSTNKTSFGGTRDGSRNHIGELCAKEAHGFSFRSEYHEHLEDDDFIVEVEMEKSKIS